MSDLGEATLDEELPFDVNYSTSGDTVYISFQPKDDDDGVHYSLFVDFLTEIVDAVSEREIKRTLELLEPSQALMAEIRRLNQKRKRWHGEDDDKTSFSRISRRCSTIGDFISLYPGLQGRIKSALVVIDDNTDCSWELRRNIERTKDVDTPDSEFDATEETEESQDVRSEDSYASHEEETIEEEEQVNPCYYRAQMEMAAILKKRIETIMLYYHDIKKLNEEFDNVEFVVYTARYRMLSDQTEKRICHPDAGVLSREELQARNESSAKKRMFMYVRSADTDAHFEQLKKDVQDKPKTLFIIIADECHWGITKDKDQKPDQKPAHNLFINEWCNDSSPRNVVVVQISATPFNLLTQNSRLPEVKCILLSEKPSSTQKNYDPGDLLVLDREPDLEENLRDTSKNVELHVVHWSEVELKNFQMGMRMKLKSTLIIEDSPYQYLNVSSKGELGVTSDEEKATDFILQGSHGIVTINSMANNGTLLAITRDTNGELKANVNPPEPIKFEVKLDFGVGVAAFFSCDGRDHFLSVNQLGQVTLQTAKVERKCGVPIMTPKHDVGGVSFQFYLDQCRPREVNLVGKQYMSLNYYLSTMKCDNKKDQKIREDEDFQRIVKNAKSKKLLSKTDPSSPKVDALLCAEYCYYILHASVYDNDNKITQALTTNDKSPAVQFKGKLDDFSGRLKDHSKYIQHEAFEFVRRGICDEVEKEFRENLKQMQKKNPLKGKNEEKQLAESFVAFLMHHPQHDLQEMQERHAASIVEDIKQRLQEEEDYCREMTEIWNCIVEERETSSLVKRLIQSGAGKAGKMKIVRAKSMETANQFFHTLQLAREISSLEGCFEIIRDYGGTQIADQMMNPSRPFFTKLQPPNCQCKIDCCCSELKLQPGRRKCTNCQHVHKLITQYEDLENLACVLILVDKGRMGDTFPQSFDCLDLRLSYDSRPLYLSTVIQELGRMCRYAKVSVDESHAQNLPYALVGRELFNDLKESPSVSSISRKSNKVDRYMTPTGGKVSTSSSLRWPDYQAHKDSYDHENRQKHCNRLLLQAEPQIGKTGTYLCLIKLLRMDILGKKEKISSAATAFNEGSFYLHKQCDSSDEFMVNEINGSQDWQFPYWKTIQDSPSLSDKGVALGKYSIGGCFYTHDMEESPFILLERGEQKPTRSAHYYQEDDCADGVRAWHWYHFVDCSECAIILEGKEPVLQTIEVKIDDVPVSVECSVPSSCLGYSHLLEQLKSSRSTEAIKRIPTLPYWIFHPSHRDDPRKCLLNYHHVMQENDHVTSYLQVVVVRSEKFQAYISTWGKVLAIFQLPDDLPNCEVRPSEGGVGYARLFIQKMAFALGLEYVYVIDDNVALMSEVEFSSGEQITSNETVLRDKHGVMKMQRCSFLKPLTRLQKIAEGREDPPDSGKQYEPHPLTDQFEAQQLPLYSYTGPAKLFGDKQHESYGVLGLLRSVPRVARPFAKTQVYAAVLLNVKSTVEKKVFYRPWPCWEDLRFNDDCDRAGLWVVKCNRYLFHKVQYKDWIDNLVLPSIFEWKSDSTLKERPQSSQLPKDLEEGIILEHLRDIVSKGPDKCYKGQIGYDRPEDSNDQLSPTRIVEKLEAREGTEDELHNEIPILIVSYCASIANRKAKDMALLFSRFDKTKEKIVFVTSARDAIERWPQLTSKTVSTHNGICLSSDMSDRNANFSIFSAADPERHHLRWILIEASFLPNVEANEEKNKLTAEANVSENMDFATNEPNVDESTAPSPTTSNTSIGNEGNSSTNSLHKSLCTTPSPQELSSVERSDQKSSSAKKSLQKCRNAKKSLLESPSVIRSIQELPSVKRSVQESSRSLQDSPCKRTKIYDYFKHLEGRISGNDIDNGTTNGKRTSENDLNYVSLEGSGEISHHQISMEKKVKRRKTSVSEKGNRKSKKSGKGDFEIQSNTSDNEQSKMGTKKEKKGRTKNSCSSTSSIHSVSGEEMVSNKVKNLSSASSYQDEEDEIFVVDDNSDKASSQTSTTSISFIDD